MTTIILAWLGSGNEIQKHTSLQAQLTATPNSLVCQYFTCRDRKPAKRYGWVGRKGKQIETGISKGIDREVHLDCNYVLKRQVGNTAGKGIKV